MASPVEVQHTPGVNSAGSTPFVFGSNVTAGNLIVVRVRVGGDTLAAPTDSQGNIYTAVKRRQNATSTDSAEMWQAVAGSSAALTVTVVPTGGSATIRGFATEISGATSAATATADSEGLSATPATGNLVVPDVDSLILAMCGTGGDAEFTSGTGYTARIQVPAGAGVGRMAGESRAVAAGTFTPDFTLDGGEQCTMVAASWKSGGGGGGAVDNPAMRRVGNTEIGREGVGMRRSGKSGLFVMQSTEHAGESYRRLESGLFLSTQRAA